jgi:hypothetical protein
MGPPSKFAAAFECFPHRWQSLSFLGAQFRQTGRSLILVLARLSRPHRVQCPMDCGLAHVLHSFRPLRTR